MKKLLGILVLVFLIVSPASWGETEDRYEIEGMSVEDNLLDYFSLEAIENFIPFLINTLITFLLIKLE